MTSKKNETPQREARQRDEEEQGGAKRQAKDVTEVPIDP